MPGNPAPSEKDCQAIPTNVCWVRGPETPHPAWVPAILARGASLECKHFVKSYDCHVVGCLEFSGEFADSRRMRSVSANRVLICVSNCCLSFGSVALLSCERVSSRSSCISAKSRSAMESVRVLQSRPPIPYSVSCRQLVWRRWLVAEDIGSIKPARRGSENEFDLLDRP